MINFEKDNYLVNQEESQLNVSVNHVISVKIIIIFSKWIDQSLSYLKPANIKYELQRGKHREVEIIGCFILLDILLTHHGG